MVSKWLHAFKRRLSAALLIKIRQPSPPPLLHAHDEDDQTPNKTDDHHKFLKVFQQLDRDGDGKVSSEELAAYFMSVGEPLALEEARSVVLEFDADGDGILGFEEFVGLMEAESIGSDDDDDEISLKMAFEMYEVESGHCGVITAQGVQTMLGRLLGVGKTNEECADMIQAFDLDGNGVLDFNEFKLLMMSC